MQSNVWKKRPVKGFMWMVSCSQLPRPPSNRVCRVSKFPGSWNMSIQFIVPFEPKCQRRHKPVRWAVVICSVNDRVGLPNNIKMSGLPLKIWLLHTGSDAEHTNFQQNCWNSQAQQMGGYKVATKKQKWPDWTLEHQTYSKVTMAIANLKPLEARGQEHIEALSMPCNILLASSS